MLFLVSHIYNKILISTKSEHFLKILKKCPKLMDSFDHCVNDSSFFIFLNESYIYLAENMHFIPISNGSVLRFSLGCPKQTKSAERSKMARATISKHFCIGLFIVSNPCKFHRDWIKIEGVMVIFPIWVILTPKIIFGPRGPPGGSGSKNFYPGISLGVTNLLGPK